MIKYQEIDQVSLISFETKCNWFSSNTVTSEENLLKKLSYLTMLWLTKSLLAKSEFKGFDFDFDIPCIVENKAELENRKSCIFDPFEWLSKQMQTNLLLTAIMVQLRKVEIAMKIN